MIILEILAEIEDRFFYLATGRYPVDGTRMLFDL